MGKAVLCALALGALLVGTSATAAPITYTYDTGSVTITAVTSTSATTIVTAQEIDLDGSFVTFDATTIDLTDLLLTIPQSDIIALAAPYGDYEEFRIESADISPGVPYSTPYGNDEGGGLYSFAAGYLDINGIYSAFDTDNLVADVMNAAAPFTDTSFISGTIDINTGTLTLSGITLAILSGGDFGETEDLQIKADITFVGSEPIPEPSTALLVGLGLVGLASSRRANFLK